jgi:hypothetical protein
MERSDSNDGRAYGAYLAVLAWSAKEVTMADRRVLKVWYDFN